MATARSTLRISRLDAREAEACLAPLVALLSDAVNHGASVGFLRPLDDAVARGYWAEVFAGVAKGSKILLVAVVGSELVGTVQLELAPRPNGRHRAEVQKLLVLSRWRRQGIATALMDAIEREAKAAGRWLLVLDTEARSGAEPFYESRAWTRCGSIPDFALSADGAPTPNIIYCKKLGGHPRRNPGPAET